jgi:hypothetical protein
MGCHLESNDFGGNRVGLAAPVHLCRAGQPARHSAPPLLRPPFGRREQRCFCGSWQRGITVEYRAVHVPEYSVIFDNPGRWCPLPGRLRLCVRLFNVTRRSSWKR